MLIFTASAHAQYTTTSDGNGGVIITGYSGPGGAVAIPGTINGLQVTIIGANAFWDCSSLTSITVPNSVTSVGNDAFALCTGLSSVTIGNNVTSIGNDAFDACGSLTNVTIPDSVTSVGDLAFCNCFDLTSVTFGSGVTSIGLQEFLGCVRLTTVNVSAQNSTYSSLGGVLFDKNQATLIQYPLGKAGSYTIPNTVTIIGNDAFNTCTSLTSVTIPNGVTSIGHSAFYDCNSLTSVTIPNSVTNIGGGAFSGCAGLTSVTIPGSVISIGDNAFYICSGLTNAVFIGNAPTMGTSVFSGAARGFTIYYYYGATGFTSPTWDGYPADAILSFAQWVSKYGLTGGATGTPQNDGVSNQIKYLLDINPSQPMSATDKAALPSTGMSTIVGVECLTLTYRASQTTSGLVVTPQVSTDLQNWAAPGAGSQTVQVGTDAATGDPMMQVQVPVSGPMMFIRLSLTGS